MLERVLSLDFVLFVFSTCILNGISWGKFLQNPKVYSVGEVDYFDFYSSDHISLIEMFSMLKELGIYGVHVQI